MKKIIVALMLVSFAAAVAFAADTVTYENKKGNITFNHKMHSEKLDCAKCHTTKPEAKVDVKGMKPGHDVCKTCHTATAKGTMDKCDYCHKK
jgi:c(7)-type cytochrome triheme protein